MTPFLNAPQKCHPSPYNEFKASFNFNKKHKFFLHPANLFILTLKLSFGWHPNWSPNFFRSAWIRIHVKCTHKRTFLRIRTAAKNLPSHHFTFVRTHIHNLQSFYGSKYRNCQVDWNQLKKISLRIVLAGRCFCVRCLRYLLFVSSRSLFILAEMNLIRWLNSWGSKQPQQQKL